MLRAVLLLPALAVAYTPATLAPRAHHAVRPRAAVAQMASTTTFDLAVRRCRRAHRSL